MSQHFIIFVLFLKFRVIRLQNGLTALLISENKNEDEDDSDTNNEDDDPSIKRIKKDELTVYTKKYNKVI